MIRIVLIALLLAAPLIGGCQASTPTTSVTAVPTITPSPVTNDENGNWVVTISSGQKFTIDHYRFGWTEYSVTVEESTEGTDIKLWTSGLEQLHFDEDSKLEDKMYVNDEGGYVFSVRFNDDKSLTITSAPHAELRLELPLQLPTESSI